MLKYIMNIFLKKMLQISEKSADLENAHNIYIYNHYDLVQIRCNQTKILQLIYANQSQGLKPDHMINTDRVTFCDVYNF